MCSALVLSPVLEGILLRSSTYLLPRGVKVGHSTDLWIRIGRAREVLRLISVFEGTKRSPTMSSTYFVIHRGHEQALFYRL